MSDALERAVSKFVLPRVVVGDGCWAWRGYFDKDGYAKGAVMRKTRRIHRVLYEFSRGPIPRGLELDHVCGNRSCVNPAHMQPVSHAENLRRGATSTARYLARTHCNAGHQFSGSNLILRKDGRRCRECERLRRIARSIRARGKEAGDAHQGQ